jgi:beta-phosphoglucomutase family hydrolase
VGIAVKLPDGLRACLFDMDGVLTQTAKIHAAAWKEMFDEFLRDLSERTGEPFAPFDIGTDYPAFVDGRLRADGVRTFLASRDIELPEGSADDDQAAETVHGLGTRKNERVLELIHRDGVEVYPGSIRFVEAVADLGPRCGVVSASKNCRDVLVAAGIEPLFEVRVDGVVAEHEKLRGKPEPDMFLEAARRLGADPARTAVFEDAVAGVEAGRAGSFGWVVGVDRGGNRTALQAAGAHVVVGDLAELLETTT